MIPAADGPWRALDAVLPDPRTTLFLRGCVHAGAAGRDAWQHWCRDVAPAGGGALIQALASHRALLPVLAWTLARNDVALDPEAQTYLRSARLTEELRWQKYRPLCASALQALDRAGVTCLVLNGAPSAERDYPSPVLRHTADVELLVRPQDRALAVRILVEHGWRRTEAASRSRVTRRPGCVHLVHPSGLPLDLHRRLAPSFYSVSFDDLWSRSEPAAIAGVPARVLSAADHLRDLCVRVIFRPPRLQWIVDACVLLARASAPDWTAFVAATRATRAGIPVHAVLAYFAAQLTLPVPDDVLGQTRELAWASGFVARQRVRPTWTLPLRYLRRAVHRVR